MAAIFFLRRWCASGGDVAGLSGFLRCQYSTLSLCLLMGGAMPQREFEEAGAPHEQVL